MEPPGLTTQQAEERAKTEGLNEIPEPKNQEMKKLLRLALSPISLMLMLAAILSFFDHKLFDGSFILVLLILNVFITFWQEFKADSTIKKLNQHLALQIKVFRDNTWKMIDARYLVKNDMITIATGQIIPADCKVLEGKNITVNEAALTGESLPKEKNAGDPLYSGSYLSTGIVKAAVTGTGVHTYFGKTLLSVDRNRGKSILEQDVIRISRLLSTISFVAVIILIAVLGLKHAPLLELMTLGLSLIIAGIPISLPTVMTLIIEFGVIALAAKEVIVRRISALEDLANVNLLLSDKTGTLTENHITVHFIKKYNSYSPIDVLFYAQFAGKINENDPINAAILEKSKAEKVIEDESQVLDYTPADSSSKMATAIIKHKGQTIAIAIGAPQRIASLCNLDETGKRSYENDVQEFANKGYRSLAIAIRKDSEQLSNMTLIGMMGLSDTLRTDAKDVIDFMKENGIHVVMLTGDNHVIAREIVGKLGFNDIKVISKEELDKMDLKHLDPSVFSDISAFAEILPDHKYQFVKTARIQFVVAVTGDGVNDLPAIKEANVGIAVKNSVDILKSTADIVLLSNGISVIKDAIIESRKIFMRLYSYSLYRISESFRLIITTLFIGVMAGVYPLTPLQLILIALLNDIPIISLAFDHVQIPRKPSKINVNRRTILSILYGTAGIFNSMVLYIILIYWLHINWDIVRTIYFLKLTVSGHMLIYVAHTKEKWFRFLPSKEVIIATAATQGIATFLALTGWLMPSKISLFWVVFVWIWAFGWMQITEVVKEIFNKITANKNPIITKPA